jgi:hypothetical protein
MLRRRGLFALHSAHDRLDDLAHRRLSETGRTEKLLGPLLGTRHHGSRLPAGPLERLLDLGSNRVGELGRLVTGLLEQP